MRIQDRAPQRPKPEKVLPPPPQPRVENKALQRKPPEPAPEPGKGEKVDTLA